MISKLFMDKQKNMGKYQPKMIEFCGWTFEAKVQPLFQGHFPFCHWEGGKSSQLLTKLVWVGDNPKVYF